MDSTVTPMGGRLLQRWLHEPLQDTRQVMQRQQWVSDALDAQATEEIRGQIKPVGDLERILTRINLGSASPAILANFETHWGCCRRSKPNWPNSPASSTNS